MRDPDGTPTQLTERQWLQIRTPLFKRWGGDWEADAAARRISTMPPMVLRDMPNQSSPAARKAAIQSAREQFADQETAPYIHSSGITIKVSVGGLKHWTSFSGDPRKIALLANLREALDKSTYVRREIPDARKHTDANKKGYHKLVLPIQSDGPSVAVITLQEVGNGNFVYDGKVSDIEIKKSEPVNDSSVTLSAQADSRRSDISQARHQTTLSMLGIKPESISVLRDEKGVPIVQDGLFHTTDGRAKSATDNTGTFTNSNLLHNAPAINDAFIPLHQRLRDNILPAQALHLLP